MSVGKLFTLIGVGLVLGFLIAVVAGVSTDLPPAVVGTAIGAIVALVVGSLAPRL